MRKRVFAAAGAVVAATIGGGVVATPGVASTCGFYEDARVAYYNHCGEGNVRIHVDWEEWGPFNDENICVRPGITGLGKAQEISNAYYVDTEC